MLQAIPSLDNAPNKTKRHRPCSKVSQLGISGRPASTHLLLSSFKDCAPVLHSGPTTFVIWTASAVQLICIWVKQTPRIERKSE